MAGGEVHKARLGSPLSSPLSSPEPIHVFNRHLRHYCKAESQAGTEQEFMSVLNVARNPNQDQVLQGKKATRALIIIKDGIWNRGEMDVQIDVMKTFFHRVIAAKIQKGSQHRMLEPLVYHSGTLHVHFHNLKTEILEGNINPIIYFDMSDPLTHEVRLSSLKISDVREEYQLHHLLPKGVEHQCPILHIGIFSRNISVTNLRSILRQSSLLADKIYNESKIPVNFIFPSETYSEDTMFAFEIGAISRFIETIFDAEKTCTESLLESQNTIRLRHNRDFSEYTEKRLWAVANSSLIYAPNAIMQFREREDALPQSDDVDPFSYRIGKTRKLTLDNTKDFCRSACQQMENDLNTLFAKCLNFVNDIAHDEPAAKACSAEWFSMAMGIEFSRFFWQSGASFEELASGVSDGIILDAYKQYSSKKQVPFPNSLFVYQNGVSPVANMKKWMMLKSVHKGKYDDKASYFSEHVYQLLARNGFVLPFDDEAHQERDSQPTSETLAPRFPQTKHLINRLKSISKIEDLRGLFNSGKVAYGLFIMDEVFSRDFGNTHWDFHKTHADNLINTDHPILNKYMTIWYENNADYRMKPAKVNKSLNRIKKRLDDYCGLHDETVEMWNLEGGESIFHSEAGWLTNFRQHLQEGGLA